MRKLIPWVLAGLAGLSACGGGGGAASGSDAAATLSWTASHLNVDGSVLADLAGYRIYHGTSPTSLDRLDTVGAGVTGTTISGLTRGTHYFAVSTLNSTGDESALSNVVTVTLP